MANTYQRITIGLGGGTDDRRVKVSADDGQAGFLEEKIVAGSTKVLVTVSTPGGAELFEIDVDETNIDHNILLNYDLNEHRPLDDLSTTTTSLWSSDKIQDELDLKINAATPMTDNKLVKSVGTSGIDVEATGIDVDDLNNVTGINNLTIDGNLSVGGTTTTIDSTELVVADANITVNNGGTKASADAGNAGLTITMSDATDVELGYDSTTASRMRLGDVGSQSEVITAIHTQTLLNKTLDADSNTLSNIETDNLKAGVLITDLDLAVSNTNIAGAQAVKDYVASELALQDAADEISFDPSSSTLVATNVQDAIDETVGRLDTVESTLASHIGAGTGKHTASQIGFINTTSGLTATDVQAALDEIDGIVDGKVNTSDFSTLFDSDFSGKSTSDLSEGTNLYHTDERSQDSIGTILIDTASINLTYDDATPQITADLTISPLTAPASIDPATDLLVMHDTSTGTIHKIKVSDVSSIGTSIGDLSEGSFISSNNVIVAADVTGLLFPVADVRSFDTLISIQIDATSDLFQEVTIIGINKGTEFDYSISSVGDDSGISFTVTNAGQIQYLSSNVAGFVTGNIRYRARTLSI